MLVYRVENFAKTGAYGCGVPFPSLDRKHPCPSDDYLLMKNGWDNVIGCYRYYFGFCSMKQLLEWFPCTIWHYFISYNGRKDTECSPGNHVGISVYEVDDSDVIVGNTQTVFILEKAERIKILSFEEELNNIIPA